MPADKFIDHYIRKQILELTCECILPAIANLQSADARHYKQIAKNKAEIVGSSKPTCRKDQSPGESSR